MMNNPTWSNAFYIGAWILAVLTAVLAFVVIAIVVVQYAIPALIFVGMIPIVSVFYGGLSFLVHH